MPNDETKKVTPKVRFPEFRDDGGWRVRPLRSLCDRIVDKVGGERLTPVSITAGRGFVSQAEKFGRDISGAQYKNYIRLRRGEFAYNKGNSNLYPQGCVYELKEFDEAAASNAFICFRLKDGNAPGFFEGLFTKNAHGLQLLKFLTSGARSDGLLNIKADEFYSVRFPIPPSPAEQRKIAACLRSLDSAVAAQGRKLEALRAHKRGLMQGLFPREGQTRPSLRFPQFRNAGEWQSKKLDDLARRVTGHTPTKGRSEFYNGGIDWVSLADSKRLDNGWIFETEIQISQEGIDNSSAVLHPAGTVVLSRDAGVGKSGIIKSPMAVSQHFVAWICESESLSNWFLYYTLQVLKPTFERIATGSTVKTIGMPFFRQMGVIVPPLAEQHHIAACLSSLDALIAAASAKLAALQVHKKGLTQQLFPPPEGA